MKKIGLLVLMFVLTFASVKAQDHIVKFKINSKEELKTLPRYVSVDNVKNGEVTAYVWGENIKKFEKLGIPFVEVPKNVPKVINMATTVDQMSDWDRYPTYDVYVQMMQNFANDFPDICRLDTIGTSQQGRLILVLEITDNIGTAENEPEFFYTSTMHGDETTGFVLMLRLISYLLNNYNADVQATNIINNVDLYINPLANPDGTYYGGNNDVSGSQRELANGTDPNRDFPYPLDVNHTTSNPETNSMMDFAGEHNFVMSANFHGGAEVYNYPWDCWAGDDSQHAPVDAPWYEYVGNNYVQTARQQNSDYMTDVTSSGVTEGYDWYEADGTRQDYMNYFHHCKEVTIELSSVKTLSSDQLPAYWTYNKQSLLDYIEESMNGVRGVVMNTSCQPLDADVTINGFDRDNTFVTTDPASGNYHRMLKAGSYDFTFSTSGYSDQTISANAVDGDATIVDVFFGGNAPTTNFSGVVENNNVGIAGVQVTLKGQNNTYTLTTDDNGNFSQDNITCGTYKISISKDGIMPLYFWQTVTTDNNSIEINVPLAQSLTGTVIAATTGDPIPNAVVSILSSSFPDVLTDNNGQYTIDGLIEGNTYQVQVRSSNYATQQKSITIQNGENVLDFAMLETNAITFEDSIPSSISYSGDADWFRTSDQAYEGSYSMKSGNISDDETTAMILTANTIEGNISFYKKVSSESSYDYLKFYIDGSLQGQWSGEVEWSQETYSISAGSHTFKWEYMKDVSQSNGDDCAWVDYIELPSSNTPATHTVTFNVTDSLTGDPVQNATINLEGYGTQQSDANGTATFTDVYETTGTNTIPYTVSASGYLTATGSISVTSDVSENVVLQQGPSELSEQNTIFTVYPNPTTTIINVEGKDISSIELLNISGQKILGTDKNSIDVSDLNSGVYLLRIISGDSVNTVKFIKQ